MVAEGVTRVGRRPEHVVEERHTRPRHLAQGGEVE